MRNAFAKAFYTLSQSNSDLFFVAADISPAGEMVEFKHKFPDRFINVGVSEQAMVGFAAGLALKGFQVFTYTIAPFSLYRPFEMVRDDLCYQNLPVTVVGMGAGVLYSTLGSTHHTQEDIAIASALPNMQILAPCDPNEVVEAVHYCCQQKKGPVYLRLGKTGEPLLTQNAIEEFIVGKIRYIKKGEEICFLSYGPIMKQVEQLSCEIEKKMGVSTSLISVHTLKPLDEEGVKQVVRSHKLVIVIEEHSPHGGLSGKVKQICWDISATCALKTYTLQDQFIHQYGSYEELLIAHGLDFLNVRQDILSCI